MNKNKETNVVELFNKLKNKKVSIELGGLVFKVVVKGVKSSYGNIRYLVTPVAGSGDVWVEKIY